MGRDEAQFIGVWVLNQGHVDVQHFPGFSLKTPVGAPVSSGISLELHVFSLVFTVQHSEHEF